ncbi:MAG: transglycosylase family protein [Acidimicrobiales bacterium]
MRTRIALMATVPVALITVSTLTQAANPQSARAAETPTTGAKPSTITIPADLLTAYRTLTAEQPVQADSSLLLDLNASLLAVHGTGTAAPSANAATAPPPGPVDTVTPDERAAWERVALCEEGGDWESDGPEFSGGLGISRANWYAYGGLQYASEGAMATEDEQIMVAERIEAYPPDQDGCHGW